MPEMELPNRKLPRHSKHNYNTPGYYFITVCTKDKACILGHFVGSGLPDAPLENQLPQRECPGGCSLQRHMQYTAYGEIVHRQLKTMRNFYQDIQIEKYVVMPNHIHLLLYIPGMFELDSNDRANAGISRFVGTFKRFCNKQIGQNIWQTSFHDHVIRGERDYQRIWQYIENNPVRWAEDCFYTE